MTRQDWEQFCKENEYEDGEWQVIATPHQEDDTVNHPSHYCDGGIETIDFIRAKLTKEEFNGYCKGNALKYISRLGKKNYSANPLEDRDKAVIYLNWIY